MSQANKVRVAVLYGGRSGEHDVSLVSATNVVRNLDRTLFDIVPIGIDKKGCWFLGDDIIDQAPGTLLQIHADHDRLLLNPALTGHAPLNKKIDCPFDVIFPAVHGVLCEDGTLQGLLESASIPYVGSGVLSSAVSMDKDVSKRLVQHAGIKTPDYIVIQRGQWQANESQCLEKINQQLHYPLFIKPVNTGSSVGVSKVKQIHELKAAIQAAFQYDTKVIIENGLDVIEIEIAVLESRESGELPIVSIPGEIRPSSQHEFYSYASKYTDPNGAEAIIPAALSEELTQNIQQMARDIFMALNCEGMARIDLFIERKTNQIYFNEVNTLPGFTQISMYPKLMAASGVNYSTLLTHLVMLALDRHQRQSSLHHEFVAEIQDKTTNPAAVNISS